MNNLIVGDSQYKIIKISDGQLNQSIHGHTHSNKSYEIHYVDAGEGIIETKNKTQKLCANTIYVNGPNVWHIQKSNEDNPLSEICINIQLEKEGQDLISSAFNSIQLFNASGDENIKNLFLNTVMLKDSRDIYSYEKKKSYIQLIITELAQMHSPTIASIKNATIDDEKFYIIDLAFLHEYATITLNELASRLGISTRQTQRLLQKHYGKEFRQKKREAQCDAGLMMLQNGASTNEVATAVGYNDTPSFIRAFKAIYGTTPKQKIDSISHK